jgi:hypothetical protein
MTHTEPARYARQRDITFLCQECGGDLEHIPWYQTGRDLWECFKCHLAWVYTERGWERVESRR